MEGSIILHYYSVRGALLCGVVMGIVKEMANFYFDVEVQMDRFAVQGVEGSQCSSTWRISAVDPEKTQAGDAIGGESGGYPIIIGLAPSMY
jgi:hypothetical protein